ncbi:threonylcarbamoyl-AMP synthase [Heliobacterium undosum]|uniref:Threonylcarbamoyl-AMP synthase n=1 Tax=Heliomicrobium undosum TaxID=121734 RepID=A0A845L4X7_9FIRM|nr:L-threonylcarbamoyladenylate synthase [Heliomicrobium undosum]MZP30756.1 threonylcarbamoyl-AMP synthase [Heliomicrobium undosum]
MAQDFKDTKIWRVEPQQVSPEGLREAAACLQTGGLVAFPTETVYGLGADALNDKAVAGIFTAKGRPSDNPLIVHIADIDEVARLAVDFPERARRLAERFWPGPLTLVLPASQQVPPVVTAGLATVAVRMPSHPVARALIREAGTPVAAPSANRSGRPSPTLAAHVCEDLWGRIDGIVDGGACDFGLESTVVDATGDAAVILRPGGVTREMIEALGIPVRTSLTVERTVDCVDVVASKDEAPAEFRCDGDIEPSREVGYFIPPSPGMKYVHYAPRAPLYLLEGSWEGQVEALRRLLSDPAENADYGVSPTGLLISEDTYRRIEPVLQRSGDAGRGEKWVVRLTGSREDLTTVAQRLFGAIRAFDQTTVVRIVAETYPHRGIGSALMNRLEKAAGGRRWLG